jgi:hypothetical protein
MAVTVTFTPTNADLMRTGYLGIRSRPLVLAMSLGFFVVLPWVLALGAFIAKLAGYHIPWLPIVVLAVLPASSVFSFALIPLFLYRHAPTLQGPHSYEFSEQDIHAVGPGFDNRVQWNVLTRCLKHRYGLLLMSERVPMVTVPGRALARADWVELLRLVRMKGLNVVDAGSGA